MIKRLTLLLFIGLVWEQNSPNPQRFKKKSTPENPLLYYIDTASPMLNSNGFPKESLFVSDSLHLSKDGYDLWIKILEPLLIDILE